MWDGFFGNFVSALIGGLVALIISTIQIKANKKESQKLLQEEAKQQLLLQKTMILDNYEIEEANNALIVIQELIDDFIKFYYSHKKLHKELNDDSLHFSDNELFNRRGEVMEYKAKIMQRKEYLSSSGLHDVVVKSDLLDAILANFKLVKCLEEMTNADYKAVLADMNTTKDNIHDYKKQKLGSMKKHLVDVS
ncbi:hypothetical protein GCM10008929_18710 [Alkalibacterium psychrotolerans]